MPAPQVSRRKRLGAWYTPSGLVDAVVAALDVPTVVAAAGRRPLRVLDPACGDGRFLFAVRDEVARLGARSELVGVDLDPAAPVFSRDGGTWTCADARALAWHGEQFDVVVGNPPFLGQLAAATTRGGRSHLGGGPYADVAAEFLALAVSLLRPGGRLGLVLPQSLLAARDAGAIRADVDRRAALRWAWWSTAPVFDAAVHTWAAVWEVAGAPGPVRRQVGPAFAPAAPLAEAPAARSWSAVIVDGECPEPEPGTPRLGSIASFAVDFRDTYYGLVGAVADDADGPPLITSGLIEPEACLWGSRPVRFAKATYAAPRVAIDRLPAALRRWAARRLVPKILIANQTRTIEAVHDPHGAWLPSVPVLTCTTAEPRRVLDVLASEAATRWVRHHAAGSGLGAHSVRLTPALLASIPLPELSGRG